ncbi:MAG: carbon starvation CstA family protein, partial [Planctomycetaceae bacterium]
MSTLLIALGAFVAYIVAYNTYGRWLSKRIFALDAYAQVPSIELNDDRDYVPTAKSVVFGHHFT